jgi:nucleoside-diphosphate-sugar epimerase
MNVFVTGASGFIGSAVVPELIGAGHSVIGLARSDASAAAIVAAGGGVQRGSLDQPEILHAAAAAADGVIHLAYIHDFSQMEAAARADLSAIEAIGAALEGTNKPLVIASGILGLAAGRPAIESDMPDVKARRAISAKTTLDLGTRGVRSSVVRLPPTVHGSGDKGFIATLISIAQQKGVSGYVGDGHNRWPAVHRLDAARLFRLALEAAPAASVLHGIAEEGVATRAMAEIIGQHLNLPVVSIPAEKAGEHFGWLGMFLAADAPASSARTRELLGWEPVHPGLLADLEQHYFDG